MSSSSQCEHEQHCILKECCSYKVLNAIDETLGSPEAAKIALDELHEILDSERKHFDLSGQKEKLPGIDAAIKIIVEQRGF